MDFDFTRYSSTGNRTIKAVGVTLTIFHAALAFAVVHRVWPDCPPGGYSLVVLLCAVVAAAEIELVGRPLLKRESVLVQLGGPGFGLLVVGFGLAFALAGGLTGYEIYDQHRASQYAAERRAAQDGLEKQMAQTKRVFDPSMLTDPRFRSTGGRKP